MAVQRMANLEAVPFSREKGLVLLSQQGLGGWGGVGHDLHQAGGPIPVVDPLIRCHPLRAIVVL